MDISPFVDWSKPNCNRQNKKSAPEYIKGGYNHPEEEVVPTSEKTPLSTRARIV